MILVTGASGTVGREVVAQMLEARQPVRALTRDPSKTRFDERVEVVRGDLGQPETLAQAVAGVERVFSLANGFELIAHEANLVQAAKTAGVKHIVKLGALGAANGERTIIADWHLESERTIQQSGLAWTVIRPGAFMSNALFWRETIRHQGKVFSNYGHGKLPPIDPRDIAAVAVRALTTDGHAGKTYLLTGPEALSVGEQVEILASVLAKRIEYVPISDEASREGHLKAGLPPGIVDALLPFAAYVRSGKAAQTLPTVEQVTGRAAYTFAQWARDHASAFA
jgi:uncharacterized protein YbjT (DUF2867 family)